MSRFAGPAPQSPFDNRDTEAQEQAAQFGIRRRELEGVLPSGSISMDAAMGIGGLPRGRIVELFGEPSTGKTTIALQCIAAVQKAGNTAAFLDAEHSFDPAYAVRVGVDVDRLLYVRNDDGEASFRILEKLVSSKAVDLIVVDSIAAMVPYEEQHASMGRSNPFRQCEMIASGLRRLSRAMIASPCCVLLVNQVRAYRGFGYEQTSSGGWAVKLHAAIRADLREKLGWAGGKRLELRVVKNQLAQCRQEEFDFADGVGVAPDADIVDRGLESGVLRKTSWGLEYRGSSIAASRAGAMQALQADRPLAGQIEDDVRRALRLPPGMAVRNSGRAVAAGREAAG